MEFLLDGIRAVTPQQCVMYVVGALLIYLAIKKDYEPSLLLPMGFGAILVNLPMSGVLNQMVAGVGESQGIIQWLFETTIEASEALPLLLFIGIGAMIDFGPLLANPKLLLFGAAAQFGIFMTLTLACLVNLIFPGMFSIQDAASVAIIGAADGPTSIFVGNFYGTPKKFVDEAMEQGKDVVLDIEVQGALQVVHKRPDVVRIFIAPPSWQALEERLTSRGTDSPEKVQKRLVRAKVELQTANTYDYFVINDTVERAVREINAIMLAEHCKPAERMAILSE